MSFPAFLATMSTLLSDAGVSAGDLIAAGYSSVTDMRREWSTDVTPECLVDTIIQSL